MRTVRVMFYKGHDNIKEHILLKLNGYSRIELIVNSKMYCITSEKGVHITRKSYDKELWDHIDIDINNTFVIAKAERFLERQVGKPYDFFGATLGQLLGLGFQEDDKWYDAELVTKFFQFCLIDEFMELNASKTSIKKINTLLADISGRRH